MLSHKYCKISSEMLVGANVLTCLFFYQCLCDGSHHHSSENRPQFGSVGIDLRDRLAFGTSQMLLLVHIRRCRGGVYVLYV